jgi:hypothetical protein
MRIFVFEMAEKALFPGCLMNVVKMADGRWLMADVIPLPRKMDDG